MSVFSSVSIANSYRLQVPDSQTNIFRQRVLANFKHREGLHFLKRNYPIISII